MNQLLRQQRRQTAKVLDYKGVPAQGCRFWTDIAVAAEQAHLLSLVSGASKVTCAAAGTNNLVFAAYSKAMPARGQNISRVD